MSLLGEGGSARVELPRLAAGFGVRVLHPKLESFSPTGSYLERVAARSMEVGIKEGAHGWIATSSGDGGTAFGDGGEREVERQVFEVVTAAAARHSFYLGITTYRHNAPGMRAAENIAREVVAAGGAPDGAYVPTGILRESKEAE